MTTTETRRPTERHRLLGHRGRPVHLAVRRRHRPEPHRADQHRLADRLLRSRRLRRRHGVRPEPHASRARADHGRARRRPSRRDARHPHPGGPPARPVRLPAQQALALAADRRRHRRRRAVRPHPRARRARLGHRPGGVTRSTARSIIDKPGKGAFYATELDLVLRTRRDHPHHPHRHHDRRLRAHDDARGQRPRLRMPAAEDCTGATDVGNYQAALKMVTMQGGVFGAVAHRRRCSRP